MKQVYDLSVIVLSRNFKQSVLSFEHRNLEMDLKLLPLKILIQDALIPIPIERLAIGDSISTKRPFLNYPMRYFLSFFGISNSPYWRSPFLIIYI